MYEEKLRLNSTPATLFVGLGGIGSDIILRVAKLCREGETDNVRFVSLDTNANDLRNIKSSKERIVSVQTSSTRTVLDYLREDDDARTSWFPNNTTLYPKTVSEGAGQVRAISRLALNATIKTGEIHKLYKAIDDLFLKDFGDLKQAFRVVIVSSSCGGTGSGISMTVGMLIREYLRNTYPEKAAVIRAYLLLPGVMDAVIPTEAERESLRRNGYATLKEINAFMIKGSGYCGVRKELERYSSLHIDVPTTTNGTQRLEGLPYDFCFLLDRMDQSQESMKTLNQYKDFAAQSLFEQNISPIQCQAFGQEDNVIKEFASKKNYGRNRFGGIGASVLKYPYYDIVDYVAYSRALDCIGVGDLSASWLKYDKEFRKELLEFKKKRMLTSGKAPTLPEVYISALNADKYRFGIDIKSYLETEDKSASVATNDKVMSFIDSFEEFAWKSFTGLPDVAVCHAQVEELTKKRAYATDLTTRNQASTDLESLREFEDWVNRKARSNTKSIVRGILFGAPSLSQDVEAYHIESLLKTTDGGMHPNAIRYILYFLRNKIKERLDTEIVSSIDDSKKAIEPFAPDFATNEPERAAKRFDLSGSFSKDVETSIDDVVALEKKDVTIIDKMGGYSRLWDALNKHFTAYSKGLLAYAKGIINETALTIALEYIDSLCKEFEDFYSSFEEKVYSLERGKNDIVSSLKYKSGDSISYVCATQDHLDRIKDMCPESKDGLLLPDALNAKIFDTIKKNAESTRLSTYDPYGSHAYVDIFDDVLLEYYRDSVSEDCDEVINLDIVNAIILEHCINEYLDAKFRAPVGVTVKAPEISDNDKIDYVLKRVLGGKKIAAPGVGVTNFSEPRTISVCGFNNSLLKLRNIDVKNVLEDVSISPVHSDTISKFELHFFNATYNLTPEDLSRFRPGEHTGDQFGEAPGIYYKAYQDFVKNIGPDSTKCATITLHVDKRWDSIVDLPEISMDDHNRRMIHIHSALIYGITHGMIKRRIISPEYDPDKRVFCVIDDEGDVTDLIVSNGTECDEFYEILDALYRDSATVSVLFEMAMKRRQRNLLSNCKFTNTTFYHDLCNFKIGGCHDKATSLFEIPIMYYYSLPRSIVDNNELSIMIDSVIDVLQNEVWAFEQERDRAPYLTRLLVSQFKLFIKNMKNESIYVEEANRSGITIEENHVIEMVLRKVSNKIKDLNSFDFEGIISELRKLKG